MGDIVEEKRHRRRDKAGAARVVMEINIEGKRGRGIPKKIWLNKIVI